MRNTPQSEIKTKEIEFSNNSRALEVYGEFNTHLRSIEESADVTLQVRGTTVRISGLEHNVLLVSKLLHQLYQLACSGYPLYMNDIAFGLKTLQGNPHANLADIFCDKVYVTTENRSISPKTPNQKHYIEALRNNDVVFGIGPAGTGKTYLAVAMATASLAAGRVQSIVLTRPAVEAGERLGFLPGDLAQKVNPYLRPLLDALTEMLGSKKALDMIEHGVIEIAPLAFMRGRTLNNAFVILDEAQNTTREQMKMFLTRIGVNSCAVVTGDLTQIDLPIWDESGLLEAKQILHNINGIHFCTFAQEDVVRHPLVQQIINAYENKKIKR